MGSRRASVVAFSCGVAQLVRPLRELMICYPDGTEARIGDIVRLAHDTDSGVVREVFSSIEQARAWNLTETGLMIDSEQTGLTFYPVDSLVDDEIRFISRVVA